MEGIIQLKPAPSRLSGNELLKSPAYILTAKPHCLQLLVQRVFSALAFARARAGSNRLARIAMIAMTTNNSIKVKPSMDPVPARTGLFIGVSVYDLPNAIWSILIWLAYPDPPDPGRFKKTPGARRLRRFNAAMAMSINLLPARLSQSHT